jgi:hypothetical protein
MVLMLFGPRRNEVTGGWRTLYIEEFHNLFPSPSMTAMITSRRAKYAGNVARMSKKRKAYRILVGKTERDHKRKT